MSSRILLFSLLALLWALTGGPARADDAGAKDLQRQALEDYQRLARETRRALVIGEGRYVQDDVPDLPGALHDATRMSDALEAAGFEVRALQNAGKQEVERALADLVAGSREGDVLLVYWSGHGVQRDGQNWLVPVDARLSGPERLQSEAIDVDAVIAQLGGADARLRLLLLDACRNNPWLKSWASTKATVPAGLAEPPVPPAGLVIGYATAPGQTARDGGEREPGPYAAAFSRRIGEPLELSDLLKAVYADVKADTGGAQLPWASQAIEPGRFFFTMPTVEEYVRRYGELRYGDLEIVMRRSGVVTVDGGLVGSLPEGAVVQRSLLVGPHRVCAGESCQDILVSEARQSSVLFEALPLGSQDRRRRAVLLGSGAASLAGSAGLGLWALSAQASFATCAGGDLDACVSRYAVGAEAEWQGEGAWEDLALHKQAAEILLYGQERAATQSRVASAGALGLLVLGSGLLTVGFVW